MAKDPNPDKVKAARIRAENLPAERRAEIARKAATARWGGEKTLKATHKGSFKEDFGIDVECYVLSDPQKTAVVSQRGMGEALGFPKEGSGKQFLRSVKGARIAPYVGDELIAKLENPIVFQGANAVANVSTYGYDVTILIDVCKAIIRAESDGKLLERQKNLAQQAHIIVGASAKAGIKGLVYALAGYTPTPNEIIAAFKFYVREEARDYEREFPNQLYQEWYRLYQLPEPERNRPWKFKHLTVNHVYWPLANSKGHILELTRAQRASNGAERRKRLHQFLSDIGVKALRQHLGQLLGIAQVSRSQEEYEGHVRRIFGQQFEFDFATEEAAN
jgi:hypothetical protein